MITKKTILNLIDEANNPSISIYLPTHEKGKEVQQDPIRLKNLINRAEQELSEKGLSSAEIEELFDGPRKLLEQPRFWRHGDRGLALFVTEDFFEFYRVPLDFKERLMIDTHFLITPMLPMISLDGTFCILAVSQKKIRLLKATRESVTQFELEEAPTSMEEFKKYDVPEKSLSSASGAGGKKSIFYGWGDAGLDSKAVENYLKWVENEVTKIMKRRNDPLILTGVDEAIAVYRNVNHYHRVLDHAIKSNPDPKKDRELKEEGWGIIKSYFLKDMYADMERFANLTGSDKQSDNLSKIVEGAYYGKVDSLFVPIGEHSWGWFDQERDVVHHSAERQNGEHDLLNVAAIKTLSQGGDVYALKREDMPNKAPVAAIFRY